jgi:glycosyltransferase involved in cell wall biosynthesis
MTAQTRKQMWRSTLAHRLRERSKVRRASDLPPRAARGPAAATLPPVNVCTIIAKNYVAQARVLARSFAEHHPDGRFWTLIIDDFEGFIAPADEPFEVLTPSQIGCDEFEQMAAIYSVLELSTAVKPWLLRHLMGETAVPITYLDPDIKIYRSLERLDELASRHGVVLIPHNSEPIPPDGHKPSQIDIMVAGVYNLGYVSLAPRDDVERLLDWWADRLRRDCRVDPAYGYFVDQRWFDLTPGFLTDFAILRDPEYNVAYWNLHSRSLEHDGEQYLVDGRPLAFFHFSGFKPDKRHELSTYQDRITLSDRTVLQRICSEYAEEALVEGYATTRRWPYGYGSLPDGIPYDDVLRRLYQIAERRGEVFQAPFTEEGAREFLDWLAAPAPGAPKGVHRLLAYVYGTNENLRDAFPDLSGSGLGRLLEWMQRNGNELVPAMSRLPQPEGADEAVAAARPQLPSELWGVNVVGYFRSELGVGEAARQVIGALDVHGVPVLPVHGDTVPFSRQGHPYTQFNHGDAEYPVNLICMNADALPEFAGQAGDWFFAGRYSIGLWFWEVSRFRAEWMPSFALLDEVWLPSAHVAQAVAAVSPIPTRIIRIPVEMPPLVPRSRADLGLPGGFVFLLSFDYRSVFERKNPLALIDAFERAFAPAEGASLVLKCINADADPENHQRLLAAAGRHPDVHVIDRYFSPEDKNTLTALSDCYVSLHRSEGFGYTMAEAMYLGKPVIATGYSGNLDFMTDENSLLVRHRLVPIGANADPYPPEGEWAEPDVVHAATLMRRVFDDRQFAADLGVRAAQSIRATHSPFAAGAVMLERLEEIRAERESWQTGGVTPRWARAVKSLRRRVEAGARNFTPRSMMRRTAREGLLRVMRPYTSYQEGINGDVSRSLDLLGAEADRTRVRLAKSNAAVLAKLRQQEPLLMLPKIVEAHSQLIDEVKVAAFSTRFQTDRSIYLAISELRRAHEAITDEPRAAGPASELTPWELRAFSQNGEDGVLAEILGRIGAANRFFVEFGVEGGREGNCVYLADVAGWNGLFMEGDALSFTELSRKYHSAERVSTVHAMVRPDNVEELFRRGGVPGEPDVLSIDVDGSDYWIWEAIGEYRPRVVIIEYNSVLDPARRLVQPRDVGGWDGTDYFGASLGAMRSLGEQRGYRLVHAELSGVNAFLVREDLAHGRFPAADEVTVRATPNYFQSGYRHPPDPHDRRYLDLDTGEMVKAAPSPAPVPASSLPANGGPTAAVTSSP